MKWGLSPGTAVVNVYEAGRDGFWLHRQLVTLGILLEKLIRDERGERVVWRYVPTAPQA